MVTNMEDCSACGCMIPGVCTCPKECPDADHAHGGKRNNPADIVTNQAGGKQSRLDARYDIIPPYALQVLAEVRHFAAEVRKYPDWNWKKIPARDHLNHALAHIAAFIDIMACQRCRPDDETRPTKIVVNPACPDHGKSEEDHAAHALCRIAMWVEMLREEGRR